MKLLLSILSLTLIVTSNAYAADEFITGKVGTIRQAATGNQVRVNLIGANTDASQCQTRNFAVVMLNDDDNFKNLYAAVLTARALDADVQFAFDDNTCTPVNSFGASFAIVKEVFVEN